MANKKIILDYRMMNSTQAKQIPLENLLSQLGCKPASRRGLDVWYLSPFRTEKTASFKLNKRLNTWYDFGMGQGGTVIDFVCYYYNESVKDALDRLGRSQYASMVTPIKQPSFHTTRKNSPNPNKKIAALAGENKKDFTLDKVSNITDATLIAYLNKRCIDLEIAKKYLKQIHYHYAEQKWQQKALGFINDAGCYEVRNPDFKGYIKPDHIKKNLTLEQKTKTITSINIQDGNKLAVFEGFMDFLSYLSYYNITALKNSAVILNSVNVYADCQKLLQDHQFSKVYFFLDNDQAGRDTLKKLTHDQDGQPVSFDWVDKSDLYAGFDDMNAFLINQNNELNPAETRP